MSDGKIPAGRHASGGPAPGVDHAPAKAGGVPSPGEDSVLQSRIDRALARWPEATGDEAEWDARIRRIEAHILADLPTTSENRVSDEDLLGPPLAEDRKVLQNLGTIPVNLGGEPSQAAPRASNSSRSLSQGDGVEYRQQASIGVDASVKTDEASASVEVRGLEAQMANQSSERDRDRRSLQDLAKLANSGGWGANNRSSGISVNGGEDDSVIDLSAYARAQEEAAAARVAAAASSGALPTSADGPESAKSPATERRVAAAAAPAVVEKKGGGPWVAIGMVAAAAIVAGAFVMTRNQKVPEPVAQAPAAAQAPQGATALKDDTAHAAATANTQAAATDPTPAATADKVAEKDTKATGGTAASSKAGALAAAGKGDTTEKPAAADKDSKTEKPATAAAAAEPAKAQAGPEPGSLEAQIRAAAGVTGPIATVEAQPTGPAPGSVPAKPSNGSVTTAVNRVLPGARACLQPDDPISHATITFGSSGAVQSVSVSGGAAGSGAEGCIKGALSKAKVEPFANPTFAFTTTIRPN